MKSCAQAHQRHIQTSCTQSRGLVLQAMSHMVSSLTGLQVLDLDWNILEGVDWALLARPLVALRGLQELGLQGQDRFETGAAMKIVAQELALLPALRTVRPSRLSELIHVPAMVKKRPREGIVID